MKSTLTRNVRRTSRGKSLLMTLRLDQRYGLQGRKASKSGSRAFDRIPDSCDTAPARLQRWRSRGAQVLGDAPKVSVRQPKVMREACDAESFERMYSELRNRFHAVAYSILGNKEDAEDAVQDALRRMVKQGGGKVVGAHVKKLKVEGSPAPPISNKKDELYAGCAPSKTDASDASLGKRPCPERGGGW